MHTHFFCPLIWLLITATRCLAADAPPKDILAGSKPQFCLAADRDPEWRDHLPRSLSGRTQFRARWTFTAPDKLACASLTLQASVSVELCLLNGTPAPPPIKGLRYATLPGISPKLLKAGENRLEIEFGVNGKATDAKGPKPPAVALVSLLDDDVDFQTEPVLGHAGPDFFTVACRTNMPGEVVLEVDGRQSRSPRGIIHAFRATGLKPGTAQSYTLAAYAGSSGGKKIGPFQVSTLPADGGDLSFIALGDSRSHPNDWARVAAAVLRKKPMLTVFSGDMVYDGREDRLWDAEFFGMAKPYFATIPGFYVMGNHETGSPIVGTLLPVPGRDRWKAVAGSALFIGIDGSLSWKADSDNLKWLEETLKASREKFIFISSHYPPWSSGPHGVLPEHGSTEARKFILPLMKKYGATVFLGGHEHCYERSETREGITVIVSGGAGAPLYGKSYIPGQNPYSKVFAKEHHFCLFNIVGDCCLMKVVTPESKLLDAKEWKARAIK